MLGLSLGLKPGGGVETPVPLPAGFSWDTSRFPLPIRRAGWPISHRSGSACAGFLRQSGDGPAIHVDSASGDDSNSGLGADGDFSQAKRSIHAAFVAGNANRRTLSGADHARRIRRKRLFPQRKRRTLAAGCHPWLGWPGAVPDRPVFGRLDRRCRNV